MATSRATWHWQRIMGVETERTHGRLARRPCGIRGAKKALHRWQRLATASRRQASAPTAPTTAFMCIHRFEGSWNNYGDAVLGRSCR